MEGHHLARAALGDAIRRKTQVIVVLYEPVRKEDRSTWGLMYFVATSTINPNNSTSMSWEGLGGLLSWMVVNEKCHQMIF